MRHCRLSERSATCPTRSLRYPTAPRCGSPCGGRCTCRSIRRRTCSKTRSVCSWRRPTKAGAAGRTCTRSGPARSARRSWRGRASSRIWSIERAGAGVGQYVILGAGLDTFAQRRPEIASRLRMFEVDQPGPQAWKRQRLIELGYGVPEWLRLVPVDFEAGDDWWQRIAAAGFDAGAAGGRRFDRRQHVPDQGRERGDAAPGRGAGARLDAGDDVPAAAGARRSQACVPACSARSTARAPAARRSSASSRRPRCWRWRATPASRRPSTSRRTTLTERYFAGRTDGLRPPSNAEELLCRGDVSAALKSRPDVFVGAAVAERVEGARIAVDVVGGRHGGGQLVDARRRRP